MSKRIALMTWHNTENYGTAYQAYALSKLIQKMDCHVDLINYKRLGTPPKKRISIKSLLLGYIHTFFKREGSSKNIYRFNSNTFLNFWLKQFRYTQKCKSNQDFSVLNSIYDGFVCGSDQIWGPEWFDARFFLDFVEDSNKLIAYSPSIGVSSIEDCYVQKEMTKLICRFSHLSLREETGCKVVRKMTERSDVLNTLDPVLTLPVNEWKDIEEQVDNLPQRYFFIFFLKNNDKNIKLSIDAASARGCVPLVLHCTQSEDTLYANIGDLTPGQLLFCLKNADYICTDSFHMTVLSIIYEKNFKVFKKNSDNDKASKNNRITNLLARLGISNGGYDDDSSFASDIDYSHVNPILDRLRKESFDYLKNAIDSLPPMTGKTWINKLDCEKRVCSIGFCKGEYSEEFEEFGKNTRIHNKRLYNEMSKYPFALKDKCYRCQYYNSRVKVEDNRKPLFWDELNEDFRNNKPIMHIFNRYYLAYFISSLKNRFMK